MAELTDPRCGREWPWDIVLCRPPEHAPAGAERLWDADLDLDVAVVLRTRDLAEAIENWKGCAMLRDIGGGVAVGVGDGYPAEEYLPGLALSESYMRLKHERHTELVADLEELIAGELTPREVGQRLADKHRADVDGGGQIAIAKRRFG